LDGSTSLSGRTGEERDEAPSECAEVTDVMLCADVELRGRLRKMAVRAASLSSTGREASTMLDGRDWKRVCCD
jgi:hypothetical protein